MHTTVAWCCRGCDAAMDSATPPDPPLCPACRRTQRRAELDARRSRLFDELEAIEIELARLGAGEGGAA